ncbi:hypothetical protein DIPPA_25519 [Diplonema papillatum]|nr:hypothetical protein DIPPA_25519 [Diplonema papillatum]|eukprot:gene11125-17105_t
MSLSIKLLVLCLVATAFVRAQDAAPEEAPEELEEVNIVEFEVKLNFTVGQNDPFNTASIRSIVLKLEAELAKLGSIVTSTFVKACEAGSCIFAFELAGEQASGRSAEALQAERAWDFTFTTTSSNTGAEIAATLTGSADALALAVSPNAKLVSAGVDPAPAGVEDDDDDELSGSAIAGIVIGCVLFVAIIAGAAFFVMKSKGAEQKAVEPTDFEGHEA